MKFMTSIILLFTIPLTNAWAVNQFETQHWLTSKGTPVTFYQTMQVPMVDIQIAFAAGSAYDGKHWGLSALTSDLMSQGNAGLSADAIAESLAETGAQYNADSNRDRVILRLKSLSSSAELNKAVQTFSKIISQPDFPEKAFSREKEQQLIAIKHSRQSSAQVATETFLKKLYQKHPYAHPVLGTKDTVQAIDQKHILAFYNHYFTAKNAVIVLVGAIDNKKAHEIAEQLTVKLSKGSAAPAIPKAQELKNSIQTSVSFPSSQTMVRLGQLGIDYHTKDYFPLLVGNYILGGGSLVSRLAIEVREKRGLTYGVYSQFIPMEEKGPFLISLSTKNDQTEKAIEITMTTVNDFLSKGPDSKELIAAKQYLTGSFPLSLASNSSIAAMLLKISFYHLPEDFLKNYIKHIEAVSIREINQAFTKTLDPRRFLLVKVGQV